MQDVHLIVKIEQSHQRLSENATNLGGGEWSEGANNAVEGTKLRELHHHPHLGLLAGNKCSEERDHIWVVRPSQQRDLPSKLSLHCMRTVAVQSIGAERNHLDRDWATLCIVRPPDSPI